MPSQNPQWDGPGKSGKVRKYVVYLVPAKIDQKFVVFLAKYEDTCSVTMLVPYNNTWYTFGLRISVSICTYPFYEIALVSTPFLCARSLYSLLILQNTVSHT